MNISIAMVQPHVDVFGPPDRLGIWFQGCPRHCLGCESPSFQHQKDFISLDVFLKDIRSLIIKNHIFRFIISGGEPFYQPEALFALLKCIHATTNKLGMTGTDILLYTGYTLEEVECMPLGKKILSYVDVLIDGEYINDLDDGKPLRGSANQRIIFFNAALQAQYRPYIEGVRKYSIDWNDNLGFIYLGIKSKIR